MRQAILFVADECPHCDYATPRVVELFDKASITLVVRKARLPELQRLRLRGFPTLYVPYASPPLMISGRDIDAWLSKHREAWACPSDSAQASP